MLEKPIGCHGDHVRQYGIICRNDHILFCCTQRYLSVLRSTCVMVTVPTGRLDFKERPVRMRRTSYTAIVSQV